MDIFGDMAAKIILLFWFLNALVFTVIGVGIGYLIFN